MLSILRPGRLAAGTAGVWKWSMAACLLAGWLGAGEPVPAAPEHYIFAVETSSLLADRSERVALAVADMVEGGLKGRMKAGDFFYLWTFSDGFSATGYPAQRYDPDDARRLSNLLFLHLQKQKWSKKPHLERVMFEIFKLMQTGQSFYVYLVLSGEESILQGTPFDREINTIYMANARRWRAAKCVSILALVVEKGRFTEWAMGVACPPEPIQQVARGSLPSRSKDAGAAAEAESGQSPRMEVHSVKAETQVLPVPKVEIKTNLPVRPLPPEVIEIKPAPEKPAEIQPTPAPVQVPKPPPTEVSPPVIAAPKPAAVPKPQPVVEVKPVEPKPVVKPENKQPVAQVVPLAEPGPKPVEVTQRKPPVANESHSAVAAPAETHSVNVVNKTPIASNMPPMPLVVAQPETSQTQQKPATNSNVVAISQPALPQSPANNEPVASQKRETPESHQNSIASKSTAAFVKMEIQATNKPPVQQVAAGQPAGGGTQYILLGAFGMGAVAIVMLILWLRRFRTPATPSLITRSMEQKGKPNRTGF